MYMPTHSRISRFFLLLLSLLRLLMRVSALVEQYGSMSLPSAAAAAAGPSDVPTPDGDGLPAAYSLQPVNESDIRNGCAPLDVAVTDVTLQLYVAGADGAEEAFVFQHGAWPGRGRRHTSPAAVTRGLAEASLAFTVRVPLPAHVHEPVRVAALPVVQLWPLRPGSPVPFVPAAPSWMPLDRVERRGDTLTVAITDLLLLQSRALVRAEAADDGTSPATASATAQSPGLNASAVAVAVVSVYIAVSHLPVPPLLLRTRDNRVHVGSITDRKRWRTAAEYFDRPPADVPVVGVGAHVNHVSVLRCRWPLRLY